MDEVAIIKDESDDIKESELEKLGLLERDLPVELSFLIRQQAFCMARMNYLDRQIRELKVALQSTTSQVSSTSINQNSHLNRTLNTNTATANTKNGHFIPSDDSGGEYSRATISDDDELSSLLDQIAKSVRPERNINHHQQIISNNQQRANYGVISNNHPHQQYAIINSNQLHPQTMPVFVMGSPIAVAHPSSINSNVLPGVHFQPEPRYNQYYDDFYVQNASSSSTLHRLPADMNMRAHQFDNSMSAIEQLVIRKEKQQIKSQLKSADNWLKTRSSGLCNINDNFNKTSNGTSNRLIGELSGGGRAISERNHPVTSSSVNNISPKNSNSVIEDKRDR